MTLVEVGDVVADAEDGVHVVRIDDGGDVVLLGDVVNELVDADGGLRVQTRVGFVAEEVLGLKGNGAGNGNALLHTARQFAGHLEKGILEPHAVEAELHAFLNLGAVHVTEHTQRESYVVGHVHGVEQGAALKEDTNLAAHPFHLSSRVFQDVTVLVTYLAAVGLKQSDEALQQYSLTRTAQSDDQVVLAWIELAVDVVQHVLLVERFIEVLDSDHIKKKDRPPPSLPEGRGLPLS